MESISALDANVNNHDIKMLNSKHTNKHKLPRLKLDRNLIKENSPVNSSDESLISKDSHPYEDENQSLESKIHLV